MRKTLIILAWAALTLAGCGKEYAVKQLIEPDTGFSRMVMSGYDVDSLKLLGTINKEFAITASDGAKIGVWVIFSKQRDAHEAKGTVVLLHGLYDSRRQTLGMGEEFAKAGYDVVLMDHRKHGKSTGQYVTYGAKEKYDVKAVVNYLLKNEDISKPIYAVGISMGAATAILYAAIDDRCKGVMAIAPYKSAVSVTRKLLPLTLDEDYRQIWQLAGETGNFDPEDADVEKAAGKLKCPLLLIHGTLDGICPYSDSVAIFKAAREPKKLDTVPLATHATILALGDSWFVNNFEQFFSADKTGSAETQ